MNACPVWKPVCASSSFSRLAIGPLNFFIAHFWAMEDACHQRLLRGSWHRQPPNHSQCWPGFVVWMSVRSRNADTQPEHCILGRAGRQTAKPWLVKERYPRALFVLAFMTFRRAREARPRMWYRLEFELGTP